MVVSGQLFVSDDRRTVLESGGPVVDDEAVAAEVCRADDGNLVSGEFGGKSDRGSRRRARRSGKTRSDAKAVYRHDAGACCCRSRAWTDGAVYQEVDSERRQT